MPLDGKNYTDTLTDTEKAARDDLFLWLDRFPARAPALLEAVREGRISGMTYVGECRCVIGTLHDDPFWDWEAELSSESKSPIERFVFSVRTGHTPASSPRMARLEEWIMQWQAA